MVKIKGKEYTANLKEDAVYMLSEILDITGIKIDLEIENTENVEGVAISVFANLILNISKKIYKAKKEIKEFLCFIYEIDKTELKKMGAMGTISLLIALKNNEDINDFLHSLGDQAKN